MINKPLVRYETFVDWLQAASDKWFLGLFARFVFLAVLFFYYENSASLKVEDGFLGFFTPSFGAYIQILSEQGMAAYDFDIANVPLHVKAIVYLGTYFEFLLPVLVVIGLFARLAALGMIGFVLVQSWVDVNLHQADAATLGAWFDRESGSLIMDQRLLWVFVLMVLVIKGPGLVSLDHLLRSRFDRRRMHDPNNPQ